MKLSEQLWNEHKEIATSCLLHPFVLGILDGSLSLDLFKAYIAQDAFFLQAFKNAYLRAGEKSDFANEFSLLAKGVDEELLLHKNYSQELGIDLEKVIPLKATNNYVEFLTDLAQHSCAVHILAGMTPCMRLYYYIGNELLRDHNPQYEKWIGEYSSEEFKELVDMVEGLLNRLGKKEDMKISEIYNQAMEFEYGFFDAFSHR